MKKDFLKNLLFFYFPLIIWLSLIYYLSSLHDVRTGTNLVFWEIFSRKIAHAGEFAFLSFLIFRVFFSAHKFSFFRSVYLAFFLAVGVAALDEFHQSFVPGREAMLSDVVFDSFGIYFGLYIFNWKKKIQARKFFAILLILFFSLVWLKAWNNVRLYGEYFQENQENNEEENIKYRPYYNHDEENNPVIESKKKENILEENKIPNEFLIKNVPFTVQSPFASWDEIHEEACEEASLIMVEYFKGGKDLTPLVAEEEIQALVSYQLKKYGDYQDTNAKETAQLAKDFYGLKLRVVYDFSLEDMKKYLSSGSPIIIPAAGRELGNPFFTPPGPLYHNLVIIGYDQKNFITNDPGTKRGKGYSYKQNILFEAIHDFPGEKEDILKGRKAMLVLE